jgi:DNA-binding LacI/PurR family transcriptional regulator
MVRTIKKKRRRSVDIHMVAERAKVSVATVSRTINRVPTVDAGYAERVWNAISELGYIPNTQARALVSGCSRLVGIIISDITNPFFPELIQSFEQEAVEADFEIMVGSTAYDSRRMEICIDRMLQRKVDGVAVMTFGIEAGLLDRLASQNIPLIFIDKAPQSKAVSAIKIGYKDGIREAVSHLAELGHKRIAFIAGPSGLQSAESRKQAFLAAIKSFGLKSSLYTGDHTLEGGIAGIRYFMKSGHIPTAVMCSNDMTAIGVLHAAAEANLQIPRDLSVIGFDDIHIARFTVPPLTTVRMSCQELAHVAFKTLRGYIEKGASPWKGDMNVRTKLTIRQSTSTPRDSKRILMVASPNSAFARSARKERGASSMPPSTKRP